MLRRCALGIFAIFLSVVAGIVVTLMVVAITLRVVAITLRVATFLATTASIPIVALGLTELNSTGS